MTTKLAVLRVELGDWARFRTKITVVMFSLIEERETETEREREREKEGGERNRNALSLPPLKPLRSLSLLLLLESINKCSHTFSRKLNYAIKLPKPQTYSSNTLLNAVQTNRTVTCPCNHPVEHFIRCLIHL